MKRAVLFESGVLVLLGALGLFGGLRSYLGSDARSQSSSMKPGMYVIAIGAALIVTALVYGVLALHRASRDSRGTSAAQQETWTSRIVLLVFGSVVLYAFFIPLIGYPISTVLFLAAAFRLLGVTSWFRNLSMTIVVSAIFYVVFVHYGEMVFPHASLIQ